MAITVRPLDAPLGAVVEGLDAAAPVSAEDKAALLDAWRRHLVLVLHGQRVSEPDLLRFSRLFGDLDPPGPNPYGQPFLKDFPEINVISNVVENGRPIGNLGAGEAVWHADMSYIDVPPKAGILHALAIPPSGGDTWFADMYRAYDALPADLKAAIEGKRCVHDASHNSAGMLRKGYAPVTDVRETPGARHPLVRTNPATGRRCLFLGRRPNAWVVGLEVAESDRLLDALWAHAGRPEFAMIHKWSLGDLLIWDNLSVLHRRDEFDPTSRRIMHRTQIKGTELVA